MTDALMKLVAKPLASAFRKLAASGKTDASAELREIADAIDPSGKRRTEVVEDGDDPVADMLDTIATNRKGNP